MQDGLIYIVMNRFDLFDDVFDVFDVFDVTFNRL
jgi:hypothetical protein